MTKGTLIGATLLVAGTTIGGGMLALPVATGEAGFFPSVVMLLVGWSFMTLTALFLSEVNLWMEEGVHIVTMASRLLGPLGKIATWILYLFIGYASLVAYTAGSADLIVNAVKALIPYEIPNYVAVLLFVLVFGTVIYLGNILVGRINTLLMIGLALSYLLIVGGGFSTMNWNYLLRNSWGKIWIAVPLLLTVFSFQTIVPSLTLYLKQDAKKLRLAICLGTSIALVVYILWQLVVLGTVHPQGEDSLAEALAQGKSATEFFGKATRLPWLTPVIDLFAFFAFITSFLGIALGLFDFLADGLKIKRKGLGALVLGALVAIPTLIFTLSFERVFLRALDLSGGIGDALLNGLIPALMLWVGRYKQGYASEYRIFGGKPLILFVIGYSLFVFTIEMLGKFGWVPSLGMGIHFLCG